MDQARNDALAAYRQKLLEHKRLEAKLKSRMALPLPRHAHRRADREKVIAMEKHRDKTENDLKALQSIGQVRGRFIRGSLKRLSRNYAALRGHARSLSGGRLLARSCAI